MEHMNMKLNGEAPPPKRKCTPWKKKTLLERYLIVICILISIAFLVMIGVVLYLEHVYTRPKVPVCTTAVCRAQAAKVLSYMDFDVDPCEDFYNFSCGSFANVRFPSSQYKRYGAFKMAEERMSQISKDLLEENEDRDEPDFVKKVKLYYKACLEVETDTSEIIRQVLNITEIYRWPILEHDDYEENHLVEKTLSTVDVNGGLNPYYRLYSGENYTVLQLYIYPGFVFGKESIFLNDTDESCIRSKEKYRNLLIYIFFKAGMSLEAIDSEVDELIRFETLLATVTNNTEKENSTETTLKEWANECKEIGWLDVVRSTYDFFGHSDDYNDEIPIHLENKSYMEELCKLLGNTKRRTIYNYLVWRFLAGNLLEFDNYVEKSYKEIMETEYVPLSKWKTCMNDLRFEIFSHCLNYLVINHLQPYKSIEEVKQYEIEVKQVMDQMFSEESWLDEERRNLSRNILSNISSEIGYSEISLDVNLLETFFSIFED